MKIIKMLFKNLIIFIISILIAVTVIAASCTSIVFNKDEVKKTINSSGVYEKMNNAAKEIAIEALNEAITNVNNSYDVKIEIDAKELLNNIDITDMFELVTNEIIDLAYSKEPPKIVINYLTSRYLEKIDEYLVKNKIELPDDVNKSIHEALGEDSLNKLVDDTEVTKALEQVQEAHIKVEEMANTFILIAIIICAIPTLLIIILSKKKVKEIVKLLSLSSILLVLFEILVKSAPKSSTEELGELVISLISSAITLLFNKVHMILVAMIAIIVILIVIKILITKTPKEKAEEEQEKKEEAERKAKEDAKIKEDGTVVSAFDKF